MKTFNSRDFLICDEWVKRLKKFKSEWSKRLKKFETDKIPITWGNIRRVVRGLAREWDEGEPNGLEKAKIIFIEDMDKFFKSVLGQYSSEYAWFWYKRQMAINKFILNYEDGVFFEDLKIWHIYLCLLHFDLDKRSFNWKKINEGIKGYKGYK